MDLFTAVISYLQYMHNIYNSKSFYSCHFFFFLSSKCILITAAKLNLPVHTLRLTMQLVMNEALRINCATKKEICI